MVARNKGIALGNIGLELGKSRQYVNAIITKGNTPKATTLSRMLDVCDYKLCAVPDELVTDEMLEID